MVKLILVALLISVTWYQYYQNKQLKESVYTLTNNYEAAMELANHSTTENHVLRLKLGDLSTSNDKMIQSIDSLTKVLKIKPKQLKVATKVSQSINATKTDTINILDTCKFEKVLTFNKYTTNTIKVYGDSITSNISIQNDQNLYIYSKKEYLRKYKSFFSRLMHLDFKRFKATRYTIINSNDLIEVKDARIIEIDE